MDFNNCNHYYVSISSDIKKVIYNPPATIVLWTDGSKTIVKCRPEDEYDKELGLLYCIAKKYFISGSRFHKTMEKWCWDDIYNNVGKIQNEEKCEDEPAPTTQKSYIKYDEQTIFDDVDVDLQLMGYFQNMTEDDLKLTRTKIQSYDLPEKIANILGMPTYLYTMFRSLPESVKLRTVNPLLEILDSVLYGGE